MESKYEKALKASDEKYKHLKVKESTHRKVKYLSVRENMNINDFINVMIEKFEEEQ